MYRATCSGARRPRSFPSVPTFLVWFAYAIHLFGYLIFLVAVVLAIVALVDWLVRTRRINPFNPIARFFRRAVDPLITPMERRVVRAGGMPQAAPWWMLVAVVIGGIVILAVLRFLLAQLAFAYGEAATGPGFVFLLLHYTFALLRLALVIRVVSSWLRISPYSRWVRWSFSLTEPILRPLRGVIPPLGMIDVTPIVAYFALQLLEYLVMTTLMR
jgi:YggT family protein